MFEVLKSRTKKRLVAAFANDEHTIVAVSEAIDKGIIDGILVGDEALIREVCRHENIDASKFRIVHEADEYKAASLAVKLINKPRGSGRRT